MTAAAVISPMMNTTIMSSTSEKPVKRACTRRGVLLTQIPVANVGIGTFAAFLAVGAQRVEVVFLSARAGEDVLVRVAPGIGADALDVAAFAPVAHRGVVGTLVQGGQPEVRRGILVVVQLVHRERGLDGLDVTLGLVDLRFLDVS